MAKLGRADICAKDNLTVNLLAIPASPTSSECIRCDPHLNLQEDTVPVSLAA